MEILSNKGRINEIVVRHKGKDICFLTNISTFGRLTGSIEEPCRATFEIEDIKEIDNIISVLEHVRKVFENEYHNERFKLKRNWR